MLKKNAKKKVKLNEELATRLANVKNTRDTRL